MSRSSGRLKILSAFILCVYMCAGMNRPPSGASTGSSSKIIQAYPTPNHMLPRTMLQPLEAAQSPWLDSSSTIAASKQRTRRGTRTFHTMSIELTVQQPTIDHPTSTSITLITMFASTATGLPGLPAIPRTSSISNISTQSTRRCRTDPFRADVIDLGGPSMKQNMERMPRGSIWSKFEGMRKQ